MSVSHLFSEALCFVVSAGRVTPESEIWYSLAHCNSPALSPVKKKKKKKSASQAPWALIYWVFRYFLETAADENISSTIIW